MRCCSCYLCSCHSCTMTANIICQRRCSSLLPVLLKAAWNACRRIWKRLPCMCCQHIIATESAAASKVNNSHTVRAVADLLLLCDCFCYCLCSLCCCLDCLCTSSVAAVDIADNATDGWCSDLIACFCTGSYYRSTVNQHAACLNMWKQVWLDKVHGEDSAGHILGDCWHKHHDKAFYG